MELSPGTRLGRYELLGPLGKGGMGEVYRARDERLGREVAIKVLPPAFAHDGDRIARFEREARLLAALNHPGIAAIYEVGEQDGRHYLVLELVPGETLAERLRAGPLPLEEALQISRQIAEALEAAHGQGIVHRDLKPANVKLTPAGKVKLLDFGLAKDVAPTSSQSDVTSSPTRSMGATEAGMVLGTVDYMSPEQARGKPIDKRTDVWAFGCLLYELLTRRPAFAGETASDVIAKVLTRDPDWQLLPATTPPLVVSVLRRCLQRDAERRLRDVGDARLEIEEALTAPVAAPAAPRPPQLRAVLVGLALIAALSMSFAVWNRLRRPPAAQRPIARFPLVLLPGAYVNSVEFSPDGSRLAFDLGVQDPQPSRKLFLRRLDQLEATPIPGTDGGWGPIFSPDGQWLAFRQREGKGEALMKVPLTGGAAAKVCTIQDSASWADDDSIYFESPSGSGIWRVSAAGGTPQRLTTPQAGERQHASARALPGGQAVLFTIGYANKPDSIAVFSPKTGTRVLVEGARDARFVPTGHLLYMQSRALMAARFDPARLELSPAVQLMEGVEHFSVAANGSLAYVPSSRQEAEHALLVVDRNGKPRALTDKRRAFEGPRFSPDGGRIAVTIRGPDTPRVWIYDIRQETLTRLTLEGSSRYAIWTPDGQRVTYVAGRAGRRLLVSRPADQSGAEEELFAAGDIDAPTSWSPDGRTLLFNRYPPEAGVWMLPLEGAGKAPKRFEPATPHWADAVVSPNGQWIAYASNESGERHVFVQPFSGSGAKRQVSIEGGALPAWQRDGKELFFVHGDDLMVAAVTIDGRFEAGRPRLLFKAPYWHTANVRNYDVAPDGQSFVMVKRERRFPPSEVVVVLNWTDELQRLVPARP